MNLITNNIDFCLIHFDTALLSLDKMVANQNS